MAIGTSPCPPFNNRPLVPGVLYDGNTVAWYKHNDPVAGVIKDGANRVSAWLDKYNYALSGELVNQATWFTLAYWTGGIAANWTQVLNHLHSDGNNGNAVSPAIMVVGGFYKITITIVRNGGVLNIGDGFTYSGTYNASGTFTSYITAQGGNLFLTSTLFDGDVTALNIIRIYGKHLTQINGAMQPLWSVNGVLFDGVNDFMKTYPFVFIQPEFLYSVKRQVTWVISRSLHDGNANFTGYLWQAAATPQINLYAGADLVNLNLVVNTFSIIRSLLNGVNSSIQINNTASIIGNAGAANMGGFTLGARSDGANNSNIEVKEIILRRSADNAATQAAIYNYLKNINSVP